MIDAGTVREAFRELFGGGEPRLFRAPGRVNLIGEHTDYNGGFVLPMAIERGTTVAAAPREDRRVRAHSVNLGSTAEFDLDRPGRPRRGVWFDYVEGVAQALVRRGARLRGADLVVESDVPAGAGLSSSAALEVSTGMALAAVSGASVERVELALAGQEAEHTYVGTMCGIMDQLTSACGREGHALLIDCRSLETTAIPLDTTETVVVVCDTRVKHELASSAYNERRADCERGVELLRHVLPAVTALRDVSVEDLQRYGGCLPEIIRRRCRHVVTENARTLRAAGALRAGCMEEMGRLMWQSHESLRDDYEVSCAELDALVEIAAGVEGVAGARMTGGGFGGSTVNLVSRRALREFGSTITTEFTKLFGHAPVVYVSEAGGGAKEVMNAE
ncbi:MAG: galactokinase [Acidobacteria bacterium]|nr:MAG: galactokinase [Acidobacteriota bacterium]